MPMPRVEGAIDPSKLSMRWLSGLMGQEFCIFYANVPLWRAMPDSTLADVEIFLYDSKGMEPYSILCKDQCGDYYTYGMWDSLEDAKAWLADPKPLY